MKNHLPQNLSELQAKSQDYCPDLDKKWSAAVCFLYDKNAVYFILRSEDVPGHKGQLAFVGGHKEKGEDPFQTARRELQEETLLTKGNFLGLLHPVKTSTQSVVIPVLTEIEYSQRDLLQIVKSNGEWTKFISVPMQDILKYQNWFFIDKKRSNTDDDHLLYFPITAGSYWSLDGDNSTPILLWGASAQMVWNSLKIVQKLVEEK